MKKCISFILCVLIVCFTFVLYIPNDTAFAATQQELQDKIEALDSQIQQNKDKLESLKNDKKRQQEYLEALEDKIQAVSEKASVIEEQIQVINNEIKGYDNQIKQLNNEISIMKEEISFTNEQISETQDNIDQSKSAISAALKSAYMFGEKNTIMLFIGCENLGQFLTRLELMRRMSYEQKEAIQDFKQQVEALKTAKEKLRNNQSQLMEKQNEITTLRTTTLEKKKELTKKQQDFDSTSKRLDKDYQTVESYITKLDKDSDVYKNYIQKLQNEHEEAEKEIEELLKNYKAPTTTQVATTNPSAADYNSAESWAWPLGNASCYISSGYGYRDASISGWPFHGGTDITGCHGKPIYATRSGTVVTAVWEKKKGYGTYTIIDHGDGYISLYGHCMSLNVTQGQYVTKGQHIANVGDTGNVTGSHLHFEIRYNGVKQDPMKYVKKP